MSNTLWKELRIGEIFIVGTGSLVPTKDLKPGKIARISAKSEDNGVIGFYDTEDLPGIRHVENCITVNFFGSDGGVFYHAEKVSLEMKVHSLKLRGHTFTRETGLFVAASLSRALTDFGYGNQLSSSKLANENYFVSLPVLSNGELDFTYMSLRIKQIEQEHISQIEAYLKSKMEGSL